MAEEAPTGGERTEAPTGKRQQDFRKKGQVAQSKEVTTAAMFTITLLFWIFYMPRFWNGLKNLVASILQQSCVVEITALSVVSICSYVVKEMFILILPLFFLVILIGFFSTIFQIGWLFTTEPLMFKISKLNPIKGMSKFISKKSFVELVKSMAKVILIGYIAYATIIDKFKEALMLIDTNPVNTILFLGNTAALILAKVCAIMILLAFIDFLFVRYEMNEKMKMTKQEVKEEHKEAEGDPRIKGQIRAIQQEMARKRMMAEVPEADVVVTNPTHLAVAIKYNNKEMAAPTVVAKGADIVAMKIREIAKENNIPLVENPPVARLLHRIDLGDAIPEEMFKAVAEILAHVYSLKGKKI